MQALIAAAVNNHWNNIQERRLLRTPSGAAKFAITGHSTDAITIRTNGGNGSELRLQRASFVAALQFLLEHGHVDDKHPCDIDSQHGNHGLLSQAVSAANGNPTTVIVTYVLPILVDMGLANIYGGKPKNTTWLA